MINCRGDGGTRATNQERQTGRKGSEKERETKRKREFDFTKRKTLYSGERKTYENKIK